MEVRAAGNCYEGKFCKILGRAEKVKVEETYDTMKGEVNLSKAIQFFICNLLRGRVL